jgi:hypothetical protein
MGKFEEILREYLSVLEQHGSMTPKVLARLDQPFDWNALPLPREVTLFDDLKTYFTLINGDDSDACHELDVFEPWLAWSMHPLSLLESLEHHELAGTPDYWPSGFLPLLMDGAGSYLVVNCRSDSPTFRAVYDMSDGVGCTRVANSLSEFFTASTREVALGLRDYSPDPSPSITTREYLAKAAPLFGNSPYFDRARMDEPMVDWEDRVVPIPSKRPTIRSVLAEPASPESLRWAEIADVPPPPEDGNYRIRLSTAPVKQWFFQKSKLPAQTTNIEAKIGPKMWTVTLTRQDQLFTVIWSSGGTVSVSSDQMKYQRLVRWPALDAVENFPRLVKQVETLLGIQFVPYADITLPYTVTPETVERPKLQAWLAPCATKVGSYIGKS